MNRTRRVQLGILGAVAFAMASSVSLLIAYVHVPAFHVVHEGRLYRSGQPTDELDWERLQRHCGIRTIVILRPWEENGGEWRAKELAEAAESGARIVHLPMTQAVPTDEQADQFLATVRDPANWPVLVHCRAGKERTGTMVALYRICVQGWSLKKSIEELRRIDDNDTLDAGVNRFLEGHVRRVRRDSPFSDD